MDKHKARILIVDDHADIRRLIRMTLQQRYEVIEAPNGVAALELARSVQPDLLVLDVMMPGELDGYKVLQAIRADPHISGMRVVILTARGQASDYLDGLEAGADAYVIKPFSPHQLLGEIERLLV